MERKKITQNLQMKIRAYLKFLWQVEFTQNAEMEEQIINKLSGSLKEELLLEAHGSLLNKFPMFYANFSENLLKQLLFLIKEVRLTPEDLIFSENSRNNSDIYFILKGKVQLFLKGKETQTTIKNLEEGEFFGEISFFSGLPRTASAQSKDFTTLFYIKHEDFLKLLLENPEDYEKYCMIRDQITLQSNYNSIGLKCFSCQQHGHLIRDCSRIHYIPSRIRIIKSINKTFMKQDSLGRAYNFPTPFRKIRFKFNARMGIQLLNEIKKNYLQKYEDLTSSENESSNNEEYSNQNSQIGFSEPVFKRLSIKNQLQFLPHSSSKNLKGFVETSPMEEVKESDDNEQQSNEESFKLNLPNLDKYKIKSPRLSPSNKEINSLINSTKLIPVPNTKIEHLYDWKNPQNEIMSRLSIASTKNYKNDKFGLNNDKYDEKITANEPIYHRSQNSSKIINKKSDLMEKIDNNNNEHPNNNEYSNQLSNNNFSDIFDKMGKFKNYFPDGNCFNIISTQNLKKIKKKRVEFLKNHNYLADYFKKTSKSTISTRKKNISKIKVVPEEKFPSLSPGMTIMENRSERINTKRISNIFREKVDTKSFFQKSKKTTFFDVVYEILTNKDLRKNLQTIKEKTRNSKKSIIKN